MIISSASNPKFKIWESLLTAKGIKKEKLFLFSGEKLVREYLRSPHPEIVSEILPSGLAPLTQSSAKKETFELPTQLFHQLDVLGTNYNIFVLKTPDIPFWEPEDNLHLSSVSSCLEIFCPLGDPSNLGSCLRNAEAFGANAVILTAESANPFLPKSVKASAGSVLRVPLRRGPSLAELPKGLIVLDTQGTPLHQFNWPPQTRLLVGEEGLGTSAYFSNYSSNKEKGISVRIPILGVESLNSSVAVGIALYDRFSKQGRSSV